MTDKPRDPKKSDTLQIRIPHDTKKDFLAACREDQVPASDRIRGWIDGFLSQRTRPSSEPEKGIVTMIPRPIRKKRYLAAGVVIAGVTAFAVLPSAADDSFRTMFDQLDADKDGRVTETEWMARAKPNLSPMFAVLDEPGLRDNLRQEIERAISKPFDDETHRVPADLHADLRSGKRTVDSVTDAELVEMLESTGHLSPELRQSMIRQISESFGKPPEPRHLPHSNPKLRGQVERGERRLERLTDQELSSLIPMRNDELFEKGPDGKDTYVGDERAANIKARQQAEGGPRFPCVDHGISDAEFANPWMNSNADDMHRMFLTGDQNHDGVVEFGEFQRSQTQTARFWFNSMDRNTDGKLSPPDAEAARAQWEKWKKEHPESVSDCNPGPKQPRWTRLDLNKDGAVSFEEYLVAAQVLDPR